MSLDLGPILGAGMLAEDEVILDALRASGFYGIRHDDFLTIIKHAIIGEQIRGKPLPPQIVLGVGTGGLMLQNQPAEPYWSRTAMYSFLKIVDMPEPDLSAPTMPVSLSIKARMMGCTDVETATNIVCSGLAGMLAKSMNMATEEIDPSRPPSAYGVDSLVAVGVRNWVFGNCGVDISVFKILSELTVFELSKLIVQKPGFVQQVLARE
ncbi:Lovastatin diketide synthase mokB [Beauveria bassiana]|nr:Lovastatin diketide synthase mokB [Beauveria bassiana]KAH8719834.1 Highly reducing polyketide synthase ZEA2 [Beauveria bassiana]